MGTKAPQSDRCVFYLSITGPLPAVFHLVTIVDPAVDIALHLPGVDRQHRSRRALPWR